MMIMLVLMVMAMLMVVTVPMFMMMLLLEVFQGQVSPGDRELLPDQRVDDLLDPAPLQPVEEDVDDDVHLLDALLKLSPGMGLPRRIDHANGQEALALGLHDAFDVADETGASIHATQRDLGQQALDPLGDLRRRRPVMEVHVRPNGVGGEVIGDHGITMVSMTLSTLVPSVAEMGMMGLELLISRSTAVIRSISALLTASILLRSMKSALLT